MDERLSDAAADARPKPPELVVSDLDPATPANLAAFVEAVKDLADAQGVPTLLVAGAVPDDGVGQFVRVGMKGSLLDLLRITDATGRDLVEAMAAGRRPPAGDPAASTDHPAPAQGGAHADL